MKTPKDIRSTGRKRLRKALFNSQVLYRCIYCHKTSVESPPDAPANFADFWPETKRVLKSSLDANHKDKNLLNNDPSNGEWCCRSCHKLADNKTEKRVSTDVDTHGY
jgi:hypothetical protein